MRPGPCSQACRHREATLVNRLAGNDTAESRNCRQHLDIGEARHPSGRNDGRAGEFFGASESLDVRSFEHSVATDVGDDEDVDDGDVDDVVDDDVDDVDELNDLLSEFASAIAKGGSNRLARKIRKISSKQILSDDPKVEKVQELLYLSLEEKLQNQIY